MHDEHPVQEATVTPVTAVTPPQTGTVLVTPPSAPATGGRALGDLIKGYWDDATNTHVKGLWERISDIEVSIKKANKVFIAVVLMEIAILTKQLDLIPPTLKMLGDLFFRITTGF